MKVMYCEVGKDGRIIEIGDDLHAMQNLVGGYIEVVNLRDNRNLLLVCNEEGMLYGLPVNEVCTRLAGFMIVGNCFICGDDRENADFGSLTEEDIKWLEEQINV